MKEVVRPEQGAIEASGVHRLRVGGVSRCGRWAHPLVGRCETMKQP